MQRSSSYLMRHDGKRVGRSTSRLDERATTRRSPKNLRCSVPIDAVAVDHDAIADPHVGRVFGYEDAVRAVVHPDADTVILVPAARPALDLIADQRSSDR